METENNGDFTKWPYTVMQTLKEAKADVEFYSMEERGIKPEKDWKAPKVEYFMSENPDNIY